MPHQSAGWRRPPRGTGARGLLALRLGTALVAMVAVGLPAMTPAAAHALPSADLAETSTEGSVGIRLVDIPAATADDPRTREYVVDHLQPGVSISRRVEISNTTDSDLTVAVYAGAASIEGDTFRGSEGQAENALTSWMSFSEETITVPPGGAILDTATIAVPADAAPGEQYAVIWAEVHGAANGPVALTARTGIRVYLSVGGDNPPASDFTIASITAHRHDDGVAAISATVDNIGGRAVDLSGTLTLASVAGSLTAGPYPVSLGTTLAPGATGTIDVDIPDDVADGPWTATLELTSGLVTESASVEITFPEQDGSSDPVPVAEDHATLALVAALLAALAVTVTAWLLVRRRASGASVGR